MTRISRSDRFIPQGLWNTLWSGIVDEYLASIDIKRPEYGAQPDSHSLRTASQVGFA